MQKLDPIDDVFAGRRRVSAHKMRSMIHEPEFAPSPLLEIPELSRVAGVARLFVKDESKRPLGNFKVLGGTLAALRALARNSTKPRRLICASDGNHGLAVAAAAREAGAEASIYLPIGASDFRAARIEEVGGRIEWIEGTYDDAVEAALAAAANNEGILVPDTSANIYDEVVADVMSGYQLISSELAKQLPAPPSHLFVQAGVGGLAAAMAEGLAERLASPPRIIVVEPETAACVAAALRAGTPVRISGALKTSAEMLSCGLASTPATRILIEHNAIPLTVSEVDLSNAVAILRDTAFLLTTASGATGLAGLLKASRDEDLRDELQLDETSRVLLILTEGAS